MADEESNRNIIEIVDIIGMNNAPDPGGQVAINEDFLQVQGIQNLGYLIANEVQRIHENQEMQVAIGEIDSDNSEVIMLDQQNMSIDEEIPAKRAKLEDVENELDETVDDAEKCSICLDLWSNYGEHRLCSLKCGHLFGQSCIKKWLEALRNSDRRCPECNTKANRKDIRVLYAKRLVAIDTAELERVKEDLREAEMKKNEYLQSIDSLKSRNSAQEIKIQNLESRVLQLQQILTTRIETAKPSFLAHVQDLDICKYGQSKAMAYNPWHRTLITSMVSPTNSPLQHGFRKIVLDTMSPLAFIHAHNDAVRDITFSTVDPNMGLSVGKDENSVLFDVRSCSIVHKYRNAGVGLWSCCWSRESGNNFHVGTNNGHILKYDIRHLSGTVEDLSNSHDKSPVVSLAGVSSFPSPHCGVHGFLACHLNSCWAYMYHGGNTSSKCLDIKGPFMSVRYDESSSHALFSCRANKKEQLADVRHLVCLVRKDQENEIHCDVVHTFNSGTIQQRITRSCYMNMPNDTIVVASNESNKSVQLWSTKTGGEVYSLPVTAPIVDSCSFRLQDNDLLGLLTPHKLMLYKHQAPSST